MHYKKIRVEVIVIADDAEVVIGEVNWALDMLEESYTLHTEDRNAKRRAHRTLARLPFYDNWVAPERAFRFVPKRVSFERAVSYLLVRRCYEFTLAELAQSETA